MAEGNKEDHKIAQLLLRCLVFAVKIQYSQYTRRIRRQSTRTDCLDVLRT